MLEYHGIQVNNLFWGYPTSVLQSSGVVLSLSKLQHYSFSRLTQEDLAKKTEGAKPEDFGKIF